MDLASWRLQRSAIGLGLGLGLGPCLQPSLTDIAIVKLAFDPTKSLNGPLTIVKLAFDPTTSLNGPLTIVKLAFDPTTSLNGPLTIVKLESNPTTSLNWPLSLALNPVQSSIQSNPSSTSRNVELNPSLVSPVSSNEAYLQG